MKKTKMLVSVAAATIALLATYTTAFADIGAYTVKDAKTGVIRQYDLKSLSNSVINSMLGLGNDLLFKDFQEDQATNGVNSIYDDSKKYVPFEEAKKALESSTSSGQAFDLNQYLKEAKAGETPTYVYERKVKDDKVVNGLNITKEGAQIDLSKENLQDYEDVKVVAGKVMITNGTIKGKLVVDAGKDAEVTVKNVTGDSITGLSGSLKLEGVVAKELVIEKAITLNVDTASTLTKLVITAPKGSEVVLSGNLGTVELNSAVKLTITEGTKVDIKVVTEEAKDTTVVAEAGAEVTTDQPIENVEGEGTVTTEPETTDPGTSTGGSTGGGGGGSYTPDHSALFSAINNILAGVNSLDDKIKTSGGYLGISTSSNSAIITLPASMTAGELLNDIKTKTTVAAVSGFTEYTSLITAIKTGAAVNTTDIENALAAELNTLINGTTLYNTGIPFIQNLVNLANIPNKAQIVALMDEVSIPQGITIKGYTVTSISVSGTEVYNNSTKKITKASIKTALGKNYAEAAAMDVKDLLNGKTVTVTLQDGSGYSTTYTISFN
ncbi:hypothetical protein CLHOM_07320 [Clostridium homopropionicum DSM 5847]|uniref:S-layer protein n=1 Tax=Clostridium homopropionicum DSM 5847 TaxID=1121318 RepID=A0A0L6ZC96_9CLOT|nr:hypothetical protein [Clostridium homopropionicum]KOA20590.1 hypothetical protein CLHOM_07320 [Clostridium homopropionicum DSM 5847]SFF93692.1 hypothetical protein SAMN04488501_103271 [Clostridium homopropionicum]